MSPRTYLITGGAGFIGSNLAIYLKRDMPNIRVIALDNLKRRGSELSLARLKAHGVEFIHGDIRVKEDLDVAPQIDCILECSAEPSVLAGYTSSPAYLLNTNLTGMLNCLEAARIHDADLIFFSTSRVYPYQLMNALEVTETATRYEFVDQQPIPGASSAGLNELFPLTGPRSLYGATKLAGELIMQEYMEMYGLRGIINRCGVVTGPWQMGKVDQGVIVLWVARHIFGGSLSYIGFEGKGKQVRDILHIEDLYRLIAIQLKQMDKLSGQIFNVGGGREISVSLRELTDLCRQITHQSIDIQTAPETRPADVRLYLSDCRRVHEQTGWMPSLRPVEIVTEISEWIGHHRVQLETILR